jgi:integrase
MQGLRSAEVLAMNPEDVLLSEGQLRVRGKGSKLRYLPLAPETTQLIDHYLRLERPNPCSAALFVVLKGPARGTRMTPAGLRSLFRYHRQTTGIQLANPHRFRHTFASDILVQRLRFFRFLDPLPPDGRLLARPGSKIALVVQLRDYLHMVCHGPGLSTSIVPHQFRHTYATEMLRSGASFPVLMKLLGHKNPDMTMRYVDVALTDLQREFQLARSKPKHLAPQPKASSAIQRTGLDGLIDSLLATQHALVMFRRSLPCGDSRSHLDRLSNRLTKILAEIRKLRTT